MLREWWYMPKEWKPVWDQPGLRIARSSRPVWVNAFKSILNYIARPCPKTTPKRNPLGLEVQLSGRAQARLWSSIHSIPHSRNIGPCSYLYLVVWKSYILFFFFWSYPYILNTFKLSLLCSCLQLMGIFIFSSFSQQDRNAACFHFLLLSLPLRLPMLKSC